jgi:hypothetical protein
MESDTFGSIKGVIPNTQYQTLEPSSIFGVRFEIYDNLGDDETGKPR